MRTLTQEAPSEAPAREVRWVHIVYLDAPGTGLCGEPIRGPLHSTIPPGTRHGAESRGRAGNSHNAGGFAWRQPAGVVAPQQCVLSLI